MKIALIYDAVYPWMKGGGEKALWDIAQELRALGHEVDYFGTKFWSGRDTIMRDGIVFHGVSSASNFYNANGKRRVFPALTFSVGLFRALWRTRRTRFDLINCTAFPFFSVFAVWLFRFMSGCRIPWVVSWLEVWGARYWRKYLGNPFAGMIGFAIEWLCARCCSHHLLISDLQARRMRTLLGVNPNRIHVIPRGVDLEKISDLVSGIPKQRRVLYVGRLLPYKNVNAVVRAWPFVTRRFPEARLRIIGDGPNRHDLLAFAQARKIDIEFVPAHENWSEVIHEIAAAAVLVQPSIREGQSVVAIEAMAARTVVVAARHEDSAISDLIEHAKNGLLINDWDNPHAWASAISLLLDDPALGTRFTDAGAQMAMSYDWRTRIVPRLNALFFQIADEQRPEITETPCEVRQ